MLSTLRLTLRRGTVYYMQHRMARSQEPHYLVVLNSSPIGDRVLIMACCSSTVERTQEICRRYPGTYVEIQPDEYEPLTTLTCVNGNRIFDMPLGDLCEAISRKAVRHCPDMPGAVVDRISAAVMASPAVSAELKRLL